MKSTLFIPGCRLLFLILSFPWSKIRDVKGDFTLGEPFFASKANVTVQIDSIDTGVKKRDDDLRSKNFFDVSKYPTMTFVAKTFRGTPESCKVVGDLTIKDVTKEVTFDGKYTGVETIPGETSAWGFNSRVSLIEETSISTIANKLQLAPGSKTKSRFLYLLMDHPEQKETN